MLEKPRSMSPLFRALALEHISISEASKRKWTEGAKNYGQSRRPRTLSVSCEGGETVSLPALSCTLVKDLKQMLAEWLMVDPSMLKVVCKVGRYTTVQLDSDEVASKVTVLGLKSFMPPATAAMDAGAVAIAEVEEKLKTVLAPPSDFSSLDMLRSTEGMLAHIEAVRGHLQQTESLVTGPEAEELSSRLRQLQERLSTSASSCLAVHLPVEAEVGSQLDAVHLKVVDLFARGTAFADVDAKGDGVLDRDEVVSFVTARWDGELARDVALRWVDHRTSVRWAPISPGDFERLSQVRYRVVSPTVMTSSPDSGQVLRQLKEGEVIQALDTPPARGASSIHCKASDATLGYATVAQGATTFLVRGGHHLTVVTETALTDALDLKRKQKEPARELKEREVLEILEHAKAEPSGLARAKVRALSDGSVGWATQVDDQGEVFLVLR